MLSAGAGAVTLGARRSSLTVRQYSPCCTAIHHGARQCSVGLLDAKRRQDAVPKILFLGTAAVPVGLFLSFST